jgi:serine/threonine-protein kinase
VVTDFGLAKPVNAEGLLARDAGPLAGTPDYMSPEQVMGGALDARSDIYSLGVVAYRTLSGTFPFDGDDSTVRMCQRLLHNTVPLRERAPTIDTAWESVIQKCLSFDPSGRFASARDVAIALAAGMRPQVQTLRRGMASRAVAAG